MRAALLAASLLIAPPAAGAGEEPLRADLRLYFDGEERGGWWFLGAGVTGLGAGTALWLEGEGTARGTAYPLAAFGLIQAAVGAVLLVRTDAQVAGLEARLALDPEALRRDELARIRKVNRTFDILMVSELVLVAAGTATFFLARRDDHDTLAGVGLGIAVEAAVTFGLDWFAAARADVYTDALTRAER